MLHVAPFPPPGLMHAPAYCGGPPVPLSISGPVGLRLCRILNVDYREHPLRGYMKSGSRVVISYSRRYEKVLSDGSIRCRMELHRASHAHSQRTRTPEGPVAAHPEDGEVEPIPGHHQAALRHQVFWVWVFGLPLAGLATYLLYRHKMHGWSRPWGGWKDVVRQTRRKRRDKRIG